jgi:hypothetical protein
MQSGLFTYMFAESTVLSCPPSMECEKNLSSISMRLLNLHHRLGVPSNFSLLSHRDKDNDRTISIPTDNRVQLSWKSLSRELLILKSLVRIDKCILEY